MFIQTEATPNPATLKFLPGRVVMENGPAEFRQRRRGAGFAARRVAFSRSRASPASIFGYDFITISKDDAEWQHLKPAILGSIMEHFMSGKPVMGDASILSEDLDAGGEFFDEGDESIVLTIKELLETRIRPAVAQDGGDITFRGFKDGKVYLNMKGSCAGCPSSTATLKHGVQNLLRHFVPEVQEVEAA